MTSLPIKTPQIINKCQSPSMIATIHIAACFKTKPLPESRVFKVQIHSHLNSSNGSYSLLGREPDALTRKCTDLRPECTSPKKTSRSRATILREEKIRIGPVCPILNTSPLLGPWLCCVAVADAWVWCRDLHQTGVCGFDITWCSGLVQCL